MNGKNIAKFRKENGLSQLELAAKIGVAKSTLSSWENNKTTPKGVDYQKLASVIGEEYLVDNDLTETITTVDAIGEVSDVVNDILYQVTNIGTKQEQYNSESIKSEIRHRRVRTFFVIFTCIFIIVVFLYTWICLVNHGLTDKGIEGAAEIETPSYFQIDDDE